jgi:hypothetical protein
MTRHPVYASNPQSIPDSAFVAGELRHLVVHNSGRLLDARRTPISVVDVAPQRGSFVVRVEAFEDAGARWELFLGEVADFQFTRDAATASDGEIAELERSVSRFDRDLEIDAAESARQASLQRLSRYRESVRHWLRERTTEASVDLDVHIERREGDPMLYALVDAFFAERDLGDVEESFCAAFVTNPRSGEVIKGHAIVLAELGLCPYRGKIPRDPDLFTGRWSRGRRSDHLLWRLAFTQELLQRLGASHLTLYRAAATDGPLPAARPSSFVSATFAREVADAHFEGGPATRVAVLWRQVVPIDRALITFLETRAMNTQFREAEALLVADWTNRAF